MTRQKELEMLITTLKSKISTNAQIIHQNNPIHHVTPITNLKLDVEELEKLTLEYKDIKN